MHTTTFKTILSAVFIFCITSCNNETKEKTGEEKQKDTVAATPPPPGNPPGVEIKEAEKKCFSSEGLKYSTIINLSMGETDCTGTVTSEELESGKKQTADFTGTVNPEGLVITFKTTAPVVGDASEWTNKTWTIKKTDGKEILVIIFNAKNYQTNKWQLTDYEFTDCIK